MPKTTLITIAVAALIIGVAGAAAYHIYRSMHGASSDGSPQQIQNVLAQVGKLMILPDEQPTLATVQDPAVLQDQPLFRNAKKGDIILVFQNARRAVIYDPAQRRLVDIIPLTLPSTPTP